jgi:hypothetical protein
MRGVWPVLLAAVVWPNTAFAAERTILVEHQHRDEPVLTYSVTVGNTQVQSGSVDGLTGYLPVVPFEGDAVGSKIPLFSCSIGPIGRWSAAVSR